MSHFDQNANKWDEPGKIKLMKTLAEKAMDQLSLSTPLDILDFGCGTGLFGLEFAPYFRSLMGIDTSQGMLDVFVQKTQGHSEIKSLLLDLESEGQALLGQYDLILSSMAFHHLQNPALVLQKLKKGLRAQGRIAIVDLEKEDGSFHPDNIGMGVKHFGFSKEEINLWAEEAGLHCQIFPVHQLEKNQKTYSFFLAIFSL